MYEQLYDTAVSLEKQEIDYTSAREVIAMLKSQISKTHLQAKSKKQKQKLLQAKQ